MFPLEDPHLDLLSRRLRGLAARRPGFALALWGEPGIGKTYVAQALLRGTPCKSFAVHATHAFETMVQTLPRPKKISVWLERSLERLERGELQDPAPVVQTVAGLLWANAPVILHVEDLHEANEARLEFWAQLARALHQTRGVGLIFTTRVQPGAELEAIRLSPLSREDSDRLLCDEAGATVPPEALGWVFERARGNPLFTLEFFRFLARRGFLWNDGQRWRWRAPEGEVLPATVEALIERVLERAMERPARGDVLEAKALLGREVPESLWVQVSGLEPDALREALRDLEREGVLAGAEFAHPLFREVVWRNLNSEHRQTLARRALDALKHDPEAAAAFVEDAKLEPGAALTLLERAAKAARDEVGSASFLARTVAFLKGEARVRRALEAAKGLWDHNATEAECLLESALQERPHDPETIYPYARLMARHKRADVMEELFARLPKAHRESAEGLAARIACLNALEDQAGVLAVWREHPELAETVGTESARAVADAMARLGDAPAASALASKLLERPDVSVRERVALIQTQGGIALIQSDFAGAERHWSEALRLCAAHALPYNVGGLNLNRGIVLIRMGRDGEARTVLEDAARAFSESGRVPLYMIARTVLAEGLFERGEYESAEDALLEAHAFLETKKLSVRHIEVESSLAELYRGWAAPHSGILALRHGRNALNCARALQNPRFLPDGLFHAALGEATFGDPQRALELAHEARQLAAERREPRQIYISEWARGCALAALGRNDEATEVLLNAQQLASETGVTVDAHRIGLELARVRSDLEGARTHLAWFEAQGHLNSANVARRYFSELEASPSPTAGLYASPMLRLEVLGPLRLGGQFVRGGKRRELLALLLEARIMGRGDTPRLTLLDALYPDTDEAQAGAALKNLVYQLRELFGANIVVSTDTGYALGGVTSDAERFLETGNTRLWHGPYLEGLNPVGNETVRETLHLALRGRAETLLEFDAAEAARVGRLLCEADPYDLESLRLTLRALRAGGNHKSLKSAYTRARTGLLEIGEVLPERWTEFLEMQIGKTA